MFAKEEKEKFREIKEENQSTIALALPLHSIPGFPEFFRSILGLSKNQFLIENRVPQATFEMFEERLVDDFRLFFHSSNCSYHNWKQ